MGDEHRLRNGDGGADRDLSVEGMALQTFKSRIDKLLTELAESPATPRKIGERTLAPAAFGSGFAAAERIAEQYETVRTRLEKLSALFGRQIEAMGLAVDMADRDYEGIEAARAARFREIQAETAEHYRPPGRDENTAPDGSELGDGRTTEGF
ncbi:hypothetical protein [Streptomyces albus]|uniref:hypothetical protein n=1 Tax=Streptomyces albus TaxID=1888 RepID=UPI000689245F|nr:hypothetical protein [Streptomyces albus]